MQVAVYSCLQHFTDTLKKETLKNQVSYQKIRARDGARRPGDVGFARTEAERRHRTFEHRMCSNIVKEVIHKG